MGQTWINDGGVCCRPCADPRLRVRVESRLRPPHPLPFASSSLLLSFFILF